MHINEYVTSREAAGILRIAVRSLYNYPGIYSDFPKAEKFGASLMYRPEELIAWRDRHETNRPERRVSRPTQVTIW